MKRFTSALLVLTLAAGLFAFSACSSENNPADLSDVSSVSSADVSDAPSEVAASGKWGSLDWALDEDGVLTISGEGDMDDFVDKSGYQSFGAWLPNDYRAVNVAVTDYDGISVKKVVISDGVTSIGYGAFRGCAELTDITIPDSVTSIGGWAFGFCSFSEINIPDSVTSIGQQAFCGCASLAKITIPDGVASIGDGAFDGCSALEEVNLPGSVTSIGRGAFRFCTALTEVNIPDGVASIGDEAFWFCGALADVTIPDSVASIGVSAFHGCEALAGIDVPEGVTSIGNLAFTGCEALKPVFIKSPDVAASLDASSSAGCLSDHAETIILGPGCTATDYVKESFPYTGTATIGGETCTWYRKTEKCAAHYYENGFDEGCNICGA